jgi:SAM-dependent methyltransferase
MQELITRYGIAGKSVLSVGAGTGEEEKHFALAGNDLLLVDIDEQRSILPLLAKMTNKPGLNYWVGDAEELSTDVPLQDVVYLSGFTPDELRRISMVRANAVAGRFWSVDDEPFHPVVMQYAHKLKPGGLLVVQSYCSSIDVGYNRNYLAACQAQLIKHDLHLMEVHRFKKNAGVMLYTAVRGERRVAPAQSISRFHGRGKREEPLCIFAEGRAVKFIPTETVFDDLKRRVRGRVARTLARLRRA